MRHPTREVLVALLVIVVSACTGGTAKRTLVGGAQVSDAHQLEPSAGLPPRISVADFTADPGAVGKETGLVAGVEQAAADRPRILGGGLLGRRVDEASPSPAEVVDLLAAAITKGLGAQNLGVPVWRLPPGAPPPSEGWLVRGQIVSVDPGNRAERAVVGFGAGDASAEVQVAVDRLAPGEQIPVMAFGTSAASGKMPGGVVTKNPYVMAAKFVMGRNATRKDIEDMGSAIAKAIADYARGDPS